MAVCLLPFCPAFTQEAEGTSTAYAEFHLIPRFDFNPYFTPGQDGDGSSGYTFGTTSLYTLIEGAFSESLSFTISNHWVAATYGGWDATRDLYGSTFRSNVNNWLDICTLTYEPGAWSFTVGKDCFAGGGHEYDDWDVDVVDLLAPGDKPMLVSNMWYNLPCYLWGATVGYQYLTDCTVSMQVASSPFAMHPFEGWRLAITLKDDSSWNGWHDMSSLSALQSYDGSWNMLATISERFETGDWTLGFDWHNIADVDWDDDDMPSGFVYGGTYSPSVTWAPSEKYKLRVLGNIYTLVQAPGIADFNIGTIFHYYPVENLRLHAAAGWDWGTRALSAMVGVRWDWNFLNL